MTSQNLALIAQNCKSRSDFLAFVKLLADDFEGHKDEWENTEISQYLRSSVAWAEDSGVDHCDFSAVNPWGSMAKFLYCGKIYE